MVLCYVTIVCDGLLTQCDTLQRERDVTDSTANLMSYIEKLAKEKQELRSVLCKMEEELARYKSQQVPPLCLSPVVSRVCVCSMVTIIDVCYVSCIDGNNAFPDAAMDTVSECVVNSWIIAFSPWDILG